MNYSIYLQQRLKSTKVLLEDLDEDEKQEEILLAKINSIRNPIQEILDYTVNHFSGYVKTSNKKIYFPILNPGAHIDALEQDRNFKNIKSVAGDDAADFLKESYRIILNNKYDNCLLLLTGLTKHRNQDYFIGKKPVLLKSSVIGDAVTPDIYGGFSIGDTFRFSGNVTMKGCYFSGPNGITMVDELETREIDGASLIIVGEQERSTRVLIKPFLEKCIFCCEEIVELWKTYNKIAP
jgi:hypothetical protein